MKQQARLNVVCLAVGTPLYLVSNGLWIVPIAAWLAPLFFLRFVRRANAGTGLVMLAVVMVAGAHVMLSGIVPSHLGLLSYLLKALVASFWFLPYVADRMLRSPNGGPASTLIFPVAVVTVEYISGLIFGTWGSVAYTQYEHLPLLQLASVTGVWGVTFVVMWFASLGESAWTRKDDWPTIRRPLAVLVGTLVLVLLGGGMHLALSSTEKETITVGWFTPGAELERRIQRTEEAGYASFRELASSNPRLASEISRQYVKVFFERTGELARHGARVVAWAEAAATVLGEDEASIIREAQTIAQENGLYLLLGYSLLPDGWPANAEENKTVWLDPYGEVLRHYLKTHPVPGAAHKAGDGVLPMIDAPFGRLSSAICYDLDFPNLIRQAGQDNVDLFLAPSWDWREIDPLHTHMAIVRAIENGFSLVRPTAMGLSMAVNQRGEILASYDHFEVSDHMMMAQVPVAGSPTIYASTGDWFAWLCVMFLLWAGSRSILKRPKTMPREGLTSTDPGV